MADVQKTVAILFQARDEASAALQKIDGALQGLGAEAQDATAKAGQLDDELGKVGGSEATIRRTTDALKALAASLIVKDFIDANVAFEQFVKTMTVATGDSAAAAREFEYVREVSQRLGVQVRDAADSYAKFAAATKGSALEGQASREIFEAFTGTLSRVGVSSAEIGATFVQLSQGISKGKFELEDLKSIAERVPGFFNKFAESLGITTEELFDLVSAGKITGAEILTLARDLNTGLAGVDFDGFNASLARFRNALDDAYLTLGRAGVFDVLVKGIQLGTAAVVGAVSSFTLLGEVVGALLAKLENPLTFDFGAALSESLDKAANSTRAARDALLGIEPALESAGNTGDTAGTQIAGAMDESATATDKLGSKASETDKALKTLGLNPDKFKSDIAEILRAFETLTNSPDVSGDTILAGLKKTLTQLTTEDQVSEAVVDIITAFGNGKLSANQYQEALKLLQARQIELGDVIPRTSEAAKSQAEELKRSEDAARKAEEAAREYALEMEKIASNERIKLIEARVALDTAQIEAATQRVTAAFDSINTTVQESYDLLGGLFDLLGDARGSDYNIIRDQIEKENERLDKQLELQEKLVDEQIDYLRAQTNALNRGDALIQVDGAGLQPHLEAFMWEILKSIQVRVNREGLGMLLGV